MSHTDEARSRSFGARLRALRESAGFTQERLAALSGLSVHAVSALERGQRRRPQVETVRALSMALNLAPSVRDAFVTSARAPADETAVDELSGISLPLPATALLGRQADITVLQEWIANSGTRLITLVGPGGVGKTRLALELARSLADERSMRVAFAPLAALRDHALVGSSVAEALGLADVTPGELTRRVRDACQNASTLLVLDNFEHVLPAAPLVTDLLTSIPLLRVLVTSRSPLHVRGEREYAVGPLDIGPESHGRALDGVGSVPAVQLFVERIRGVEPQFVVTSANASTVTAICHRLDGLPLALELAAPWVKTLGVDGLLRGLERDELLAAIGPRDLPARQQTMNATVAWSYQLLDPDEQRAFRRLSVLPNPFPLEAASELLAGPGGATGSDNALRAMAALIDKSLLLRADTSTRSLYYMLETVRAYSAVELTASGERDDAWEGLVRYTTAQASLAGERLNGPAQVEWLIRVREELESYRGALTWLLERGRSSEAAHIASSLMFFWAIRGHAAEGLRWYEQILTPGDLPRTAEARVLVAAGLMRYMQGEPSHARTALTQALVLAHEIDDTEMIAQAENLLGRLEHSVGNLDAARERYTRSTERFRALGLPWGLGSSLTGMAAIALASGAAADAERLLDEATSVLRHAGPWFLALTLYVRAIVAVGRGRADEAIAVVRESLTRIRELQDKYAFVYTLGPLAAAAVLKGDDAWAARILGARDAVTERTGATVVVRHALDDRMELAERELRVRLGSERWALAYAAGREASIDALMTDIDRASHDHNSS
jgi:predicted ATPase/DNA-binding XRE family transcriptional regulator